MSACSSLVSHVRLTFLWHVLYILLNAGAKPVDHALNVHSNQSFTPLPPQENRQVIAHGG